MADASDDTVVHLRQLREALKTPISDVALLVDLLSQPLALLALSPSAEHSSWPGGSRSSQARDVLLSRFMGSLQTALLQGVVGVWWEALATEGLEGQRARAMMEAWFCPRPAGHDQEEGWDERRRKDATRVAIAAYRSLAAALSPPSPSPPPSPPTLSFIVRILASLAEHYPLSRTYPVVLALDAGDPGQVDAKAQIAWETFARTLVGLPSKLMNASEGGRKVELPDELMRDAWYRSLVGGMDAVIQSSSTADGASISVL